jgi:alpha-1,3-mannosyltransferase
MNILLFLPGFLFLSVLSTGMLKTSRHVLIILASQVSCPSRGKEATRLTNSQLLLSLPFTLHDPSAYLRNAFQFSRAFLYQWTVNWRFIPEPIFLSKALSRSLILVHLDILYHFANKWAKPHGGLKKVVLRSLGGPTYPGTLFPKSVTPECRSKSILPFRLR